MEIQIGSSIAATNMLEYLAISIGAYAALGSIVVAVLGFLHRKHGGNIKI